MSSIVSNAYIFKDRNDKRRLFAEVVSDNRYETGHHIVTSEIISMDGNKVITESDSNYIVENFLDKDEFIAYVTNNYDKETAKNYLYFANIM